MVKIVPTKTQKSKQKKLEARFEKTISLFEKEHASIKKLIGSEAEDFQTDKASLALYRAMLVSVLEMIPLAETTYTNRPTQSNLYAFNALLNQAREIANDIRTIESLEDQVSHINTSIVRPSFAVIINNLVASMETEVATLSSAVPNAKYRRAVIERLRAFIETHATVLKESSYSIEQQLETYLVEKG